MAQRIPKPVKKTLLIRIEVLSALAQRDLKEALQDGLEEHGIYFDSIKILKSPE